METWKEIAGWPYEVSNFGHVRRLGSTKNLKGTLGGTPPWLYPVVVISNGIKNKLTQYRHILVAEAFLGPCPVGMEVNHKNHNRMDSSADNLEYVTSSGNKLAAVANGYCGERRYNSQLNQGIVRQIRQLRNEGWSTNRIASRLKISLSAVCHVVAGRAWKHVA